MVQIPPDRNAIASSRRREAKNRLALHDETARWCARCKEQEHRALKWKRRVERETKFFNGRALTGLYQRQVGELHAGHTVAPPCVRRTPICLSTLREGRFRAEGSGRNLREPIDSPPLASFDPVGCAKVENRLDPRQAPLPLLRGPGTRLGQQSRAHRSRATRDEGHPR